MPLVRFTVSVALNPFEFTSTITGVGNGVYLQGQRIYRSHAAKELAANIHQRCPEMLG
jgi:hypothetical protein